MGLGMPRLLAASDPVPAGEDEKGFIDLLVDVQRHVVTGWDVADQFERSFGTGS
jgi:hypothetical protein